MGALVINVLKGDVEFYLSMDIDDGDSLNESTSIQFMPYKAYADDYGDTTLRRLARLGGDKV